jgi:LmbE family N-acetylglucosaminyl deacetylase
MTKSILDRFQPDAVAIFVGSHADDEHTVGALLAFAADRCREVIVVSLTRGESGWNLHREDLTRTLAEVRRQEFESAVRTLGCVPLMFDYINGTSKAHPQGLAVQEYEDAALARWRAVRGRTDHSPEGIIQRWTRETGDPAARLVRLFREKEPSLVIADEPAKGYSNHPEHQATGRLTLQALAEYNRTARRKASLYWSHCPADTVPTAERITTESLSQLGGQEYRRIADQSQDFYESQYGSRGSERAAKYLYLWHDQQLIEPAGEP